MKQTSFSDAEFASKKKLTRRERFQAEIDDATPWAALVAALLPYYPKGDGRGRPPIDLERMLRMYIAQQCLGLSDEGIEDAIYNIQSVRRFVGIDLTHESAPDATTLLKFRRLLEESQLTRRVFEEIKAHLASKGLTMREGTIVDATLIAAPPSTKNRDGERDPEMHQSKKGNDWHFGMKAHVGVDMAWRRNGRAGRRRLPGRGQAPRESWQGDQLAYRNAPKRAQGAQKKSAGPSLGKAGASEGQRACEGRALRPCREGPAQTSQDALPRPGQE